MNGCQFGRFLYIYLQPPLGKGGVFSMKDVIKLGY